MAAGVVSRDTGAAREIVVSARNGFPWQASIGAAVEEFEFVKENQKVLVNGREFLGPVNVVRKATLGEISFVDLGADGATSASVVAVAPRFHEEKAQMDESLSNNTQTTNLDAADASQVDAQAAPCGQPARGAEAPQPGPTAAEIRAQALAETNRIAEIRQASKGEYPEIEARAIREGWDGDRCRAEVGLAALRDSRPKAPAVHLRDDAVNGTVLEAACVLTAKAASVETMFDEPTLDAAQRRFRGGIGLQELLLEAAWANGYTGRNFRDSRAVLRFAFRPGARGRVLDHRHRRHPLQRRQQVPPGRVLLRRADLAEHLRDAERQRLQDGDQLPPDRHRPVRAGPARRGTEARHPGQRELHEQGRHLRPDAFDRPAGHHQRRPGGHHHGAPQAGAWVGTEDQRRVLGHLPEQRLVLHDRQQELHLGRRHGLVDRRADEGRGRRSWTRSTPTASRSASCRRSCWCRRRCRPSATQLYKSVELRDTTSSTKYPVANPHQGKFRTEVSRYLSNSHYTGYSRQGLVPAGRSGRPAGDRGGVPQRPGGADDRDGRGRLLGPGRPDARLPRFWLRCRTPRRCEAKGKSIVTRCNTNEIILAGDEPTGDNTERWRFVPGAEGYYSVSDLGRVRSEPLPGRTIGRQRGRVLQPSADSKGYPFFRIMIPGCPPHNMKVHRAVAAAFLGPRNRGMQVNHKNGNKRDNRLQNLEYVTCRENIQHCWQTGLHNANHCRARANRQAKLTAGDVQVIRRLYPDVSLANLANLYGVTKTNVWSIVRRKTWKHI